MNSITLLGVFGSFLVLVAFVLNQLNLLKNSNYYYDLINFLGSLLLVIYAMIIGSLPFAILNGVWVFFSLKDIILYFKKR